MVYESFSIEDTENMAHMLAQEARKGDIICLCGNLGAGKTTFAQGFAKGLGCEENITSPTFTLMNVYEEGRLPLYHFDLYRLETLEDLESIGYEDYFYANGVCLIEWAERAKGLIPEKAIWVELRPNKEKDDEYYREIYIDENIST